MQIQKNNTDQNKLIVIVGPTASGKTGLSLELAAQFNGEIISADSRQVYRGLDIGTEKITKAEMNGIPHHLIDVREPTEPYSAADFARDAKEQIREIHARGNVPIIVGGTFFYIDTLLGKQSVAEVAPNEALRADLEKRTTTELFEMLKERDPKRAETIDPKNKRRLIRALEIIAELGSVPNTTPRRSYDVLIIGIDSDLATLRTRINERLLEALEHGLVKETEEVLARGVSEDRLREIGLEYRIVLRYINKELTYKEMVTELQNKVWQYAKRQLTWLKRDRDIRWFTLDERTRIECAVRDFLES